MTVRMLPSGERAVLIELDSLPAVLALHAALTGSRRPAELVDAVPGARTLLLVATSEETLSRVQRAAEETLRAQVDVGVPTARSPVDNASHTVEIPVRYDGPDLRGVAALTGLTPAEIVLAHTGRPWLVGFVGFAPGFAYLVGGDPRLQVPRHAAPRARVPAGAVALAGEFSGIYPRASPGGWQLIGHTRARLWDVDRQPPALLVPGMTVRFVDDRAAL